MKVLHLSGATSWGGNEQQLVDIIFGLEKWGVVNTIFCFKDSPLEEYARENGINYYSVPKSKGHSLKLPKSLKTFVKSHKPDVIHLHTSNAVTFYVIADIFFGIKVPALFSKKGIGGSSSLLSKFKYNYKGLKKIVCVSDAVLKSFKDMLKPKNYKKLCVVHDGIKLERSQKKCDINFRKRFKISSDYVLVGNIGNHNRAKDLVTMVKTVNVLVNDFGVKNVHFIQIGKEGKYSNEFLPLIKKYDLNSYITIAGHINNAMDALSQIDVFLITSEREGGPSSGLEAMYKKKPIVSTKVGVMPEVIMHKENGLLSPIKDVNHLAENLRFLIKNKALWDDYGNKSHEILINNFTSKDIARKTLTVYEEILNNE